MAEELDLETYLYVSQNKFEIFLFNKKNLKNIYEDKIIFNNKKNYIDLNSLDKFLADNIFSGFLSFIFSINQIVESILLAFSYAYLRRLIVK